MLNCQTAKEALTPKQKTVLDLVEGVKIEFINGFNKLADGYIQSATVIAGNFVYIASKAAKPQGGFCLDTGHWYLVEPCNIVTMDTYNHDRVEGFKEATKKLKQ